METRNSTNLVLGGGISGLFAGYLLKAPILEKKCFPGGLLASYCFDLNSKQKYYCKLRTDEFALFEIGGGHWIWGLDDNSIISDFLTKFSKFKKYVRKAQVLLVDYDVFVPYPIQYNLRYLPKEVRDKALEDLLIARKENIHSNYNCNITFAEFLKRRFGETLYEIFFEPYNYIYTAGLLYEVAPPRKMKRLDDLHLILKGYSKGETNVGYNATFRYPITGLGYIMYKICSIVKCFLNSEVTFIDLKRRKVVVNNKHTYSYTGKLFTSLPLLETLKLCDAKEHLKDADPYISVLVVNVIAKRGRRTPNSHWVYISKTKTRFHRIGYYSNVDELFLPGSLRKSGYVATYIEKTYRNIDNVDPDKESERILNEAMSLELIGEPITYDFNLVKIAYTFRRPNSVWVEQATRFLKHYDVIPIGRYATWGQAEGVVESMKDVLKKVALQ